MKAVILLAAVAVAASMFDRQFRTVSNAPIHSDIEEVSGMRMKRGITNDGSTGNEASTKTKPSALTSSEAEGCLFLHNKDRSDETEAAGIIKLEYDDTLAGLAQFWAEQCNWKHGNLYDHGGKQIGQNMFMAGGGSSMPTMDFTSAIKAWYDEKPFYHRDTKTCDSGQICGHYTQVVWAKTRKVGCGYAKCPIAKVGGSTWTNAIIYVCDYDPGGNVQGQAIYENGASCSKCNDLVGPDSGCKCDNGLCAPCVPRDDPACSCGPQPNCQNGGTYSPDDCVCVCPKGYYGPDCSKSCECSNLYPGTCDTWAPYCADAAYYDFMKTTCPVTCGRCDLPEICNNV